HGTTTIGLFGSGTLTVSDGAQATLQGAVVMAQNPGSAGSISADGTNTHIRVYQSLDTGLGGTVDVTNDAAIDIGGTLATEHLNAVNIGNGGTLLGAGEVKTPVFLEAGGTVAPGDDPGILTVDGDYTQSANTILSIEIGGPTLGTDYSQLLVGGAASIAGELDVVFINSYVPTAGDFVILDSASLSGMFDAVHFFNVPADLNVTYTNTSVIIGVPEPADIGLLCLALLPMLRRRRSN
ncbi:MAG TPA: hypothetical protein VG722_01670, partial [Tepidisphaeraceae bacterium]|nr:hypothetical protein [Tepidisphaeraceae bacterium]